MPWIGTTELGSGTLQCEEPLDAGLFSVALTLPSGDLPFQGSLVRDAPVKALFDEHADLDFHHVQPACVLLRTVEFEPTQNPSCLFGGKGFAESTRAVRP